MGETVRRNGLALVAILLVSEFAVLGQDSERLSSLLEKRVTFSLPSSWTEKKHISTATRASAQFDLPNIYAKAQTPTATLSVNLAAELISVKQLSDGVYKNRYEGLSVLTDTFDGENWRTIVWGAKAETAFIVLQRFGVIDRVGVEVLLILYLPADADLKAAGQTIADFNAFCKSLKIDGTNKFDHPVSIDRLLEARKTANKP